MAGSPARNAGNPGFTSPPDFDQRGAGYERIVNGQVDIGAYEVQAPSADFDGDGDVDGRDFLFWQRGMGTPAPTAVKAQGDTDNDLAVDGADLGVWQDQYGTGSLVAEVISDLGLMIGDEGTEVSGEGSGSREPLGSVAPWAVSLSSTTRDRVPCYDDAAHEDSYIEQVDRAIDQLSTTPRTIRSFGQMVAQRGITKPRPAVEVMSR